MKKLLKILFVVLLIMLSMFFFSRLMDTLEDIKHELRNINNKMHHTELGIGYTHIGEGGLFLPVRRGKNGRFYLWVKGLHKEEVFFLHTMVIAKDPLTGRQFYISAGESECGSDSIFSGSSTGSSGTRCCEHKGQLCAVAEFLTTDSIDNKEEILNIQRLETIGMSFREVVARMKDFAKDINKEKQDYDMDKVNCHYFSSKFVEEILGRSISPDPNAGVYAALPGWNGDPTITVYDPTTKR